MTDEAKVLVALQKSAGLKTTPTPLTHDLRIAVSGEGPRADDWQDKPHRLLYDACAEIETQAREVEKLREGAAKMVQEIAAYFRRQGMQQIANEIEAKFGERK